MASGKYNAYACMFNAILGYNPLYFIMFYDKIGDSGIKMYFAAIFYYCFAEGSN